MTLSRRQLLRASGAAAATVALGGLAESAVASPVLRRHGSGGITTLDRVIVRDRPNRRGWQALMTKAGEGHLVREDLGAKGKSGRAVRRSPVLAFAQLSDVHVIDAQSPARLESGEQVSSSAFRPQETMSTHVAEAMVRELNEIGSGPVTGVPLAFALQTGDNSDNSQYNEIRWNIDVLDGGTITPDSGDLTKFEGVQDGHPDFYDTNFWHPHGAPAGKPQDRYRKEHGFPRIPGLLDKVRAPFQAQGLSMPWIAAFGNHDQLAQGNFAHPVPGFLLSSPTGSVKKTAQGDRVVTPDPDRRFLSRAEWMAEHFVTTGAPAGHGFTESNLLDDTGYYTFDQGAVRFIVMDSVNENGGEAGSLDQAQFTWIKDVLASTTDKLVVFASHHTSWTMENDRGGSRVLGEELVEEMLLHDHVIAWVNGHTHENSVSAHTRETGGGFWEINSAAHIDFPQQSRLIEIADNEDGTVSIFTTMVDHAARIKMPTTFDGPLKLAALSRLLSANDPGYLGAPNLEKRRGTKLDRNVELLVAAPAFMTATAR